MHPSIYRLRLQDILTLCVLGLLLLGALMVQSAAINVRGHIQWTWEPRAIKHLLFVAASLLVFFIVGRFNYSSLLLHEGWANPVRVTLIVAIVTCAIVLIPGIGKEVNGARRWLPFGPLRIQPSEIGKWAIVLFMARWFAIQSSERLGQFWKGFVPTLVPAGIVGILVVKEDFGTAALIGLCALTICLAGRIKLWHLAIVVPPAIVAGIGAILIEPYRRQRILSFLDPWKSPQTDGYHMIQSLLSYSSGGIFGTGLGRGVQKLGYLPEDTTDFIFSVICEELGIFGALFTVALYLGVLFVAWQAIRQRKDTFGRLAAFGIAAMIGLQALINIAVATVSVPPKGLSLPLVSAGGTGLVITCAALGVLYNICRQADETAPAEDVSPASENCVPTGH